MDHLSSRIISIAKNAFDCDQCEDCDFDKNNKILPIVSMINKKDYDSLNGHCDSIRNDENIKHGLFLTTCAITDDIQMIYCKSTNVNEGVQRDKLAIKFILESKNPYWIMDRDI